MITITIHLENEYIEDFIKQEITPLLAWKILNSINSLPKFLMKEEFIKKWSK